MQRNTELDSEGEAWVLNWPHWLLIVGQQVSEKSRIKGDISEISNCLNINNAISYKWMRLEISEREYAKSTNTTMPIDCTFLATLVALHFTPVSE